jgi:type IV secretory pathway TraG/TraD family ATPase VirD4
VDLRKTLWDFGAVCLIAPDLEMLVCEGRKFGACALLAMQSPAQIEGIYGRESARTIFGNCLTRVAFGEQDPDVSKQISAMFGEKEVQEFQEGISYGAHQMRDGVNLSQQKRSRAVVSPSDIQSLRPLEFYLRSSGNLPVVKQKLAIVT